MSKLKNIILVASGVFIGVAISFSTDIYAATSKLLGSNVSKVVTVKKNGKVIGDGAVINGTTYLPVRAIVNTINGIEVGSVDSTEVNLITPSSDDLAVIAAKEQEEMDRKTKEYNDAVTELRTNIKSVQKQIEEAQFNINIEETSTSYKTAKIAVELYEKGNGGANSESGYLAYKAEYDRLNKAKEDAILSLPRLKEQLAGLESQLAELQK